MSKLTTLVLVVLVGLGVAGAAVARAEEKPAAAGAAPPQMAWEKACEADMKSLCAAEMKGDVRPCLAKNETKLSKQCTDHFSAAGFRVAQLCDADFDRLCKAEAAAGQLGKCINAKIAQLSEKCRAALVKGSEKQDAKEAAKKEKAAAKAAAKAAKTHATK